MITLLYLCEFLCLLLTSYKLFVTIQPLEAAFTHQKWRSAFAMEWRFLIVLHLYHDECLYLLGQQMYGNEVKAFLLV